MIVDLMRNDLGRVCEYGSIEVPALERAAAAPGVWHLVSTVRGRLRAEAGDSDLLRASFPPGSVTGAPKIQAMRVIAELEAGGREAYTGAIGFASPVAGLELNVAIRTLRDARRADLDGRGRRHRGRLGRGERARGVLREGAPGDSGRGRPPDRGAARDARRPGARPGRRGRPPRPRARRVRDDPGARRHARRPSRPPGAAGAQRGGALRHTRCPTTWRRACWPRRPARRCSACRWPRTPHPRSTVERRAARGRACRPDPVVARARRAARRARRAQVARPAARSTSCTGRLDAVPLHPRPRRRRSRGRHTPTCSSWRERISSHPPLDGRQLPGTVRARVLALHPAREERLTLDRVAAADELLLASSIGGIRPARFVDGEEPRFQLGARLRAALREDSLGATPMKMARVSGSPQAADRSAADISGARSSWTSARAMQSGSSFRAGPSRHHRRGRARHVAHAPARAARSRSARSGGAARVRLLAARGHAAHDEREVRGRREVAADRSAERCTRVVAISRSRASSPATTRS